MKDDLKEAVGGRTMLEEQLAEAADSVRQIGLLRNHLAMKDDTIQQLQTTIGEMKDHLYDVNGSAEGIKIELTTRMQQLQQAQDQLKLL